VSAAALEPAWAASGGLTWLDATAQAELVRSRLVSPTELVEAAIARMELLNPLVNAVVTPLFDEARAAAAAGPPDGPFAGVPFLVKDLIATVGGARQTEGSRLLEAHVAREDSELVRRFRKAGLVIAGKTNTPEFGGIPVTEGRLFGPARNPWDVELNAGGSSGGSAAAVATGMVAMAHGNDGGGSLRNPASCCGVFGFKPSRGRVPFGPEHGDLHCRIIVEHALTRTVRDSAALLDATSGACAGDPYRLPPPRRPYAAEVDAEPGRLRIAFTHRPLVDVPVHPECRAAVEATAGLCAELGHDVVEARPALDGEALVAAWFDLWADGNAWMVAEAERRAGRAAAAGELEPLTERYRDQGRARTALEHLVRVQAIQVAARELARFFEGVDVWLTPTVGEPGLPNGAFTGTPEDPPDPARYVSFSPFARLANMTGQPAMSVPLHWTGGGLPVGTHAMARLGEEDVLFRLAGQLERARPWRDRRPALGQAG
jgi:amidase